MWSVTAGSLGEIALRTGIVYLALLLGVRLSGKREIGQMTPFDLVVLLLVSNAVQNAMTGPDTSVSGGMVAAATLLLINFAFSRISLKLPKLRQFIDGMPILLVSHGQILYRNLKHEGITFDELMGALREHECRGIEDVEIATLEIDGDISVIRRSKSGDGLHHTKKRLVRHSKKP